MAKKRTKVDYVWGLTRISLGLIFLWAFLDKFFGLGFTTCRAEGGIINYGCDAAWSNGGSPTEGFLKFATKGPFADTFQSLAGNGFIDFLFMLGLLGIGVALVLGIGVKLGGYLGATMLVLMYAASAIWPEHHPFLDEHLVYAMVLVGLVMVNDRQALGFGPTWRKLDLVKNHPILE